MLTPSQVYGAHEVPTDPSGAMEQTPSSKAPIALEHTSHAPVQAASQQTPSTQEPLRHWLAAVQLAPA